MTSLKLGTPKRPAFSGHHNLRKNILFFTKKHIFYFFFHFTARNVADKRKTSLKLPNFAISGAFVNRRLPKRPFKNRQKTDMQITQKCMDKAGLFFITF